MVKLTIKRTTYFIYIVFFSVWQIAILSFLQCPLYQIGNVLVTFYYMSVGGVYCDSPFLGMLCNATQSGRYLIFIFIMHT